MKTINPLAYLAGIAATQIGHHEDGDSNTGSQIAAYQAATGLGIALPGHGYAWCCAFVDWCILQLIQAHPGLLSCESPGRTGRGRPTTASVAGFLEWATESGQMVMPAKSTPQAGDICVMHFPTGNHIGIVAIPGNDPGTCHTIEGNTSGPESGDQRNGGEVASKFRGEHGEITAFIRLSLKGERVS